MASDSIVFLDRNSGCGTVWHGNIGVLDRNMLVLKAWPEKPLVF